MIMMTYNQAIAIQDKQLDWYTRDLTESQEAKLRAALAIQTKPCPFDPAEEKPSWTINELVPRGADIERELRIVREGN